MIGKAPRLTYQQKLKQGLQLQIKFRRLKVKTITYKSKRGRKSKLRSLIIEKDFEQKIQTIGELDENSCKWQSAIQMKKFYFCGRASLKIFLIVNFILYTLTIPKR